MNFLDANVIIRLIEGSPAVRQPIEARLAGATTVLCSQFSRLECRCHPLRAQNQPVLDAYDTFFGSAEVIVVPIDQRAIDVATEIRATHASFKSPDAIQLERRALARSVAAVAEAAQDVAGGDGRECPAEGVVQRVDRPGGEAA